MSYDLPEKIPAVYSITVTFLALVSPKNTVLELYFRNNCSCLEERQAPPMHHA
jgi:hypothetical protein